MKSIETEPYLDAVAAWPQHGRHILSQHDAERVVVYQAYRPSIGHFAAQHGHFGGDFSYARMSWIKPNFLWMMYRCGWATKEGQEVVLAVTLRRSGFDAIRAAAVASSFGASGLATEAEWRRAGEQADVRVQWDPDHDPYGAPTERRAIQLGMRGDILRRYGREWIIAIEDVTAFVREQHAHVLRRDLAALRVPRERVLASE